jgi:hypothetical protein
MNNDSNFNPLDPIEKRLRADKDRECGENYGLWWLNTGRSSCFVHESGRYIKDVESYLRQFDFDFKKGLKSISEGDERILLLQERYSVDDLIEKSAVLDAGIHFLCGQKYLVAKGPSRVTPVQGEFSVTRQAIFEGFPVETDREFFLAWIHQTVRGFYNSAHHHFGPVLILVGEDLETKVPEFFSSLIGELTIPSSAVLNSKPRDLLAHYGWLFPPGAETTARGPKSNKLQNFFQLCYVSKLICRGEVWPAFGRGIVCLNEESYSLKPLEEYLWKPARKLVVLHCLLGSQKAEIWDQMLKERAAFLWHLLHEYRIPEFLIDEGDHNLRGFLSPVVDRKCFEGTGTYAFLLLLIEAFRDTKILTEAKLQDYLNEGGVNPETARVVLRKLDFVATMKHLAARYPEHIIHQDAALPKWQLKSLKKLDL